MFQLLEVGTLLLPMFSRERKEKTSCTSNIYGGVYISEEDKGNKI